MITKINLHRRAQWAKAVKGWNQADWADAIFSDEFRFGLQNGARKSRVWRKAEENNNPAFFKPVFLRGPVRDGLGMHYQKWCRQISGC